ncbi:CocE/NonD family hydrolase [Paraflavitalea pollutisoli]|uniref:CocE/NonD family hydrolase n=1 Tax=Paraflavitalea pollutisoli TaxID=3034143 RepID=UPI0023ED17C7|nr:CocE/NonD family hydrolase [Paraflavitalea sp. H1-2-19X]
MRTFLAVCYLLIGPLTVFSQQKPSLPAEYFDQFHYQLSDSLRTRDEAALRREIGNVAAAFLDFMVQGEKSYTIDSLVLYDVLTAYLTPAVLVGKHDLAINTLQRSRALKPAPPYRAPFGFMQEAYARAGLKQADDNSAAFSNQLKQELAAVVGQLDPSFSSDIVNAQKGLYSVNSINAVQKDLNNIIRQANQSPGLKVNFGTAYTLLDSYFRYYIRKAYQPAIEAQLYVISPARVVEAAVMIPMRDQVRLSGLVYRDTASTVRVPAIVSLSPYPSGYESTRGNVFATNGYVYVYVDSRGRRKSEGNFFPYEDDARDYYDIIDWVSKQPWCNGDVVTSGGSYLGFAQWQAIRKPYRHPALKAINPMVSVGFGIDFPRFANQFYSYILQWAAYVSGRDLNDALFGDEQFWNKVNYALYKNRLPFAKLDSVAGMPNPFFQKWVSHPDLDSYWTSILPNKADYTSLDIPVLTITGYYDADQLGAFYYYDQHKKYAPAKAANQHYLLIGPYDHGGAQWQPSPVQLGFDIEREAQIPIYKYVIWWYDWVLKGKARPAFLQDQVNYFVTGTGQWKSASTLQQLTTDTLSLYLSTQPVASGKRSGVYGLQTQRPVKGTSLTYTHDIAQVIDSAFLYARSKPFDDSLYMASPYNLVFDSKPMEQDIIVTGKMVADLYLSLNVPDADFQVNIYEIDTEGKSYMLTNTILRSRYRLGGDKGRLLKPGTVALHRFDDVFLYIKKIPKGNKLRMTFESVNSPGFERNYGFGGVVSRETTQGPRLIKATLHSSPVLTSRIKIPYTRP